MEDPGNGMHGLGGVHLGPALREVGHVGRQVWGRDLVLRFSSDMSGTLCEGVWGEGCGWSWPGQEAPPRGDVTAVLLRLPQNRNRPLGQGPQRRE